MKYLSIVIACLFLLTCKSPKGADISAQDIVEESIDVSGGEVISASVISFDFRNRHYKAIRKHGIFSLERQFKDSTSHATSSVKDVLNNDGFERYVDDLRIEIPDSIAKKYTASVNSVHYFSVLPYGLNDEAVNTTMLADQLIKDQMYFAVKVTFDQNGGGEDFDDVFLYWINKATKKVDYLAYSYHESDGKGMRFREAYNERYVNGVRFVDYNNYKPEKSDVTLSELPQLFESRALKLVSKIELENVHVDH